MRFLLLEMFRCISKYNTIIAIEAYQEDAEDLTEAPKFYINKRDRTATDQGLLVRHYVDAVHIYRICRKADIHATNPNFRRHVMWIEAIEPNQQESPSKKVIEYMWKGKSKPDTLYGMQLEVCELIKHQIRIVLKSVLACLNSNLDELRSI